MKNIAVNNIIERLVSILTYWTAGFFGLIYLIFMCMTKKSMSSFVMFNIYQSIFISILLYIVSFVYKIFIGFAAVIPFVGKYVLYIDGIIFKFPILFGCTMAGILLLLLSLYFTISCILGKKPFIPFVSQVVQDNFGY
mgnify:CR=1 FL=1